MSSSPVRVELQVARHLSMRHSVWRLLQAEGLEVHASAAVRDDEVRIHGTLHPSGIFTEEKEKLLDEVEKNSVTQSDLLSHRGCTHLLHLRGRA